MKESFISVPFKADDGMSQIDGLGKFSPAGIVLEFESKLFGIIKNGVKEARIATDEILDIKFRKGFMKIGARVHIRLKSFTRMGEFPNKDGKIILKIKREDFERAQNAVERLEKQMNEPQEPHQTLPPAHTPVSVLFDESEDETKKLRD